MKRKILFINIFIIFILFFIIEIISYQFLYGYFRQFTTPITMEHPKYKIYSVKKPNILENNFLIEQRNDDSLFFDKTKKPIIVVGCSYAYGQGIKKDKIFSSQLQIKTKRKVINISQLGAGTNDALKSISYLSNRNILQNNQFEYVIYVQMYDHIARLHDVGLFSDYLLEKNKNTPKNSKKEKFKNFLYNSYTIRFLKTKQIINHYFNEYFSIDYLKYQIEKMNEIIKEANPKTELVVLLYDDITNAPKESPIYGDKKREIILNPQTYKNLENQGIKIISTKALVGDILYKEEFQLKIDPFQKTRPHHPNEKAWETLIPELIKILKL